ncbi:hypothetical protein [Rhodococcus ruber]|uniref:hypothetical protein n=1 Tax=Rhodococcus ruber TaxID=1830 RepID=UPI00315CCAC7
MLGPEGDRCPDDRGHHRSDGDPRDEQRGDHVHAVYTAAARGRVTGFSIFTLGFTLVDVPFA